MAAKLKDDLKLKGNSRIQLSLGSFALPKKFKDPEIELDLTFDEFDNVPLQISVFSQIYREITRIPLKLFQISLVHGYYQPILLQH